MFSPLSRLNSDFARIFGGQVEQNLDPASQTGDFVLPNDADKAWLDSVAEMVEVNALAERVIAGTANEADKQRLLELSRPVELEAETDGDAEIAFDLTNEACRIYHFPDNTEVEVDNPHTLTIGEDGTHYITPYDRVGIEVPPRWVKIEVFPKQGEACFVGHPPVNEIE